MTTRTKEGLAIRDQRVIAHAKAGLSMAEICDREGLDLGNADDQSRMLRSHGLAPGPKVRNWLASGLENNSSERARLGGKINMLRDRHSQIELSHMLGMTNAEINAAKDKLPTHNWKFSQMQRLADALGISLVDLLNYAFTKPGIGFKP